MTNSLSCTEIDQTVALDWLRFSLGQGEVISPEALTAIEERRGYAYTLAPDTIAPARLANLREGGITGTAAAEEAIARVLGEFAERGAACVVVEDDLHLRRDPNPSLSGLLKTAFVGERVVHWAGLASSPQEAVLVLHRGSSTYPMNAFVTSVSEVELGLTDGADLDSDIAPAVVGSLMAVIVAAFDGETFLAWEPNSHR